MKPSATLTILTGASHGMGLAMAKQLLVPGTTLLCISRTSNDALGLLAKDAGCTLEQWRADLSDAGPVAHRLSQWLQAWDTATLTGAALINNAAFLPAIVPLHAADAADVSRAMRVNLEAPMLLTSAFLQATLNWPCQRKVLNISSGLGRRAMASQSAYCAAKAGMDHFSRCVALDEAALQNGARVCSLAPGVIDTGMQMQLRSADARNFPDIDAFAAMHSNGQLDSPAEAARKVLAYLNRSDFGEQPVADVRGS
jgi:benzil reductase ((S)-benzoin forming)